MKTKLFTQKSFLVMLTLVLAFSVQGIAEALRFTSQITRTDKPKVSFVYPNQTFDLRFTVRLEASKAVNANTRKASQADINFAKGDSSRPTTPNPLTSNYTETVDADYTSGETHYYTVTTVAAPDDNGYILTTNTRNWTTEAQAYYYNGEAVTIAPWEQYLHR